LSGPVNRIIDVTILINGREFSGESFFGDDFKTFFIPKPKSGKVTMIVDYWINVKEVSIPIER
jgi:hypothetical protein